MWEYTAWCIGYCHHPLWQYLTSYLSNGHCLTGDLKSALFLMRRAIQRLLCESCSRVCVCVCVCLCVTAQMNR